MGKKSELRPLFQAQDMGKPATACLVNLMKQGKARRMEVLQDPCGIEVQRWLVGKHTGILMMTPHWWEFFAPIVPVDAENATLSAIEHMAEAE